MKPLTSEAVAQTSRAANQAARVSIDVALLCDSHERLREEVERLYGLLRRVIEGKWCVTDLQEAIGDLDG